MSPDTTAASYRLTPYGQAMVEENLGLAWAVVNRTQVGRNLDPDDRLQVACVALCEAVAHFDESRGYRFSSYACRTMLRVLHERSQTDGLIGVTRHGVQRASPAAARARRIRPLWPEGPKAADDTFATVRDADQSAAVRTVVDSLPEPLPCLVWSRAGGMGRDAIARAMGLRPALVRTLEGHAYRRLRPLLSRLADGP